MLIKKVIIALLLVFVVFTSSLMAEDNNSENTFVDNYEEFKKEIALSFNSLKLIAAIGNENLNLNLWSGLNTYPDYMNKYITNAIDTGKDLSTDYLIRTLMNDTTITKEIRKNNLIDFIRRHKQTHLSFNKENDIIYNTLKNAFEEDLKGAINEIRLHKKTRIDAKWKKNLLNKVDVLKDSIGNMETTNIDNFYDSLTSEFDKNVFNKVRQNVKSKN
ncbi:MAG: hypothetical protein D3918_14840, partial [Candidatus Electrothrix sp. AX2]|nr:hypothetical protein [Candidatus Electrothrix gigas]